MIMNRPHTINHHEDQLHTNVNLMDHIRKYLQVGAIATALAMPITMDDLYAQQTPSKKTSTEYLGKTLTFVSTGNALDDVAALKAQHPEYIGRRGNMLMIEDADECREKLMLAINQNRGNRDYLSSLTLIQFMEFVGAQAQPANYQTLMKDAYSLVESVKQLNETIAKGKRLDEAMAFAGIK